MTLIEFYDPVPIRNVLSALLLSPSRLILAGTEKDALQKAAERIRVLLKGRNAKTEVMTVCLKDMSYDTVSEGIEALILRYEDCMVDLVGGDPSLFTAMGALAEKHGIKMHLANPADLSITPFTKKEAYPPLCIPRLSVREIISLYGGTITESSAPKIDDSAFRQDILTVFEVSKKNCGDFNAAISALHSLITPEDISPTISMKKIRETLSPQKAEKLFWVLYELSSVGAITAYQKTETEISFRYKSRVVQAALHKEGSALEFYTYYAALSDFGTAGFQDGKIGVVINWDGEKDGVRNEIDVMLTDNITPIFISCKNGYVGTEELYKLSVVSDRFGGPYAKKAIVMTRQKADISFLARARELGISVISDVQEMTLAGFSNHLKRTLKNKM